MTDLDDRVAGSSSIDPRIRARRIAVRRSAGRRRLRRLAVGVGAVMAAILAWGATRTPLLDVDAVRVEGSTHTAPTAVAAASGIVLGDAMADVDAAAAEQAVEALPWVARATVALDWPGTVRVRLTERAPVAAVPGAGAWALVDGTGRVLELQPSPAEVLPRIAGVPLAGAPGATLDPIATEVLDALGQLPTGLGDRVRGVDVAADGLRLAVGPAPGDDGVVPPADVTVVIGPARDVPAKAVSALAVLDRVDVGAGAVLDVRVPSAPALVRGR